jgi:hypothetical protein
VSPSGAPYLLERNCAGVQLNAPTVRATKLANSAKSGSAARLPISASRLACAETIGRLAGLALGMQGIDGVEHVGRLVAAGRA